MREFRQLFDDTVLPAELLRVQIRARYTYRYHTNLLAHACRVCVRVLLFLKAEKINKQERPASVLNSTHASLRACKTLRTH